VTSAKNFDVRSWRLDEPALWCWEISDTATGQVVETSWSAEWAAYDSPADALAAGQQHLASLEARAARAAPSTSAPRAID
jgi:hypothetical protein